LHHTPAVKLEISWVHTGMLDAVPVAPRALQSGVAQTKVA